MQGIRDQIFLKTTRVAGSGASGREAPFLMHLRITCCKGQPTVLVLSGCSTKDTLKTYAYLPTMVLNGVGDIASIAKEK